LDHLFASKPIGEREIIREHVTRSDMGRSIHVGSGPAAP
jgi:hypothetical protein